MAIYLARWVVSTRSCYGWFGIQVCFADCWWLNSVFQCCGTFGGCFTRPIIYHNISGLEEDIAELRHSVMLWSVFFLRIVSRCNGVLVVRLLIIFGDKVRVGFFFAREQSAYLGVRSPISITISSFFVRFGVLFNFSCGEPGSDVIPSNGAGLGSCVSISFSLPMGGDCVLSAMFCGLVVCLCAWYPLLVLFFSY